MLHWNNAFWLVERWHVTISTNQIALLKCCITLVMTLTNQHERNQFQCRGDSKRTYFYIDSHGPYYCWGFFIGWMFLKMGQSQPLFVYFRLFPNDTIQLWIYKSLDGVLGIWTRGCSMEGADESTELLSDVFSSIKRIFMRYYISLWPLVPHTFYHTQRWSFIQVCTTHRCAHLLKRMRFYSHTNQRTLISRGSITVQLVSSLNGLDSTRQGNMLFLVCTDLTEPKRVLMDTSHTVILPLVQVFSTKTYLLTGRKPWSSLVSIEGCASPQNATKS